MKVKDREFQVYIGQEELAETVGRLAARIDADYAGRRPMLCPVLTGAFIFAADLVRRMQIDAEVCFVKYTSYQGMESTGTVTAALPFPPKVAGRDVIIVEDVVDTGLSMEHMLKELRKLNPRSVRICSLFFKPGKFQGSYKVDYVGKEIGDEFIVGYGLDYDDEGRGIGEVLSIQRQENLDISKG